MNDSDIGAGAQAPAAAPHAATAGSAEPEIELRLVEDIAGFWDDPLGFVHYAFAWGEGALDGADGPDRWQSQVLDRIGQSLRAGDGDLGQAIRLAVASGHGVGKTALVAWIILWFMSTRPHCAGVVTANTQAQLSGKTWRELAKWHLLAINRHWFQCSAAKFQAASGGQTWFIAAVPWNKDRAEAFAGLHEKDVLIVYDEASGIDDRIWEVSEGAMTTAGALWLAFGNPTRTDGAFARCFSKFRHRWQCIHVDARNAKMADGEQIARWVEDYGEDSDFVRVRVRGVFPRASAAQFVDLDLIEAARKRQPEGEQMGPLAIGVDVARFGDDQSVIYVRDGRATLAVERYRGLDTMQLAGHVGEAIGHWRPDATFIDGVGVGGGVVDRLRQLGHRVIDVSAASRATDERRYANKRAEMWGRMRAWLAEGGCLPAHDQQLADDLAAPQYGFDASNRIQLERKDEMKARGTGSPDAADALALTFAEPVAGRRHAAEHVPYADISGFTV